MSNVVFEEDTTTASRPVLPAPVAKPFFYQMLISSGIAKDEKGAQVILVIFIVVAVVATLAIMILSGGDDLPAAESLIRSKLPPQVR